MARYLVTRHPGAPIPGVGFVKPGEEFTAPDGYQPSRTFLPLDKEAQEALAAVFAKEKDRLEKQLKAVKADDIVLRNQLEKLLEDLEAQRSTALEVAKPPPPPPKQDEGMTVAELGNGKKKPDSGRAADK